jgi:lipopolysaccharide transport system permease protein
MSEVSTRDASALVAPEPATGRMPLRPRLARVTDTLMAMTVADLRGRYGRGWARLLKWMLDPFALVGVYLVLVTVVLRRGGEAPGLSLACAIVPFQIVMSSVTNSLGAISSRRSIILNMSFNRMLIPVSGVLTEVVALGASVILLVLMMAVYGIAPTVSALWLPAIVLVNILLAVGIAYPAALLGLWFPDMRLFLVSLVRTLYFLAPGLVSLSQVSGAANDLVRINPLTGLFEAYRDALLYGQRPATWELVIPLGFAALLLLMFLPVFRREQRHFAKVME